MVGEHDGVEWVHLAGNVAGADIGYLFPGTAGVKGLREARSGSWYNINNDYGSTIQHTRNYLSLWLDHGSNPAGATYAYALLPNQSATAVAAYAAAPQFTIIGNSANVQAVREDTLGVTAANFWADATHTAGGITCDRKAAVVVRDDGTELRVAIADPTQLNTGTIRVEIAAAMERVLAADPRVTVEQVKPTVKLLVNVNGGAGASFGATLIRASGPNMAPVARDDTTRAVAGTPQLVEVLANDSDPDSGPEPLALLTVTQPAHGRVEIEASQVRYTADEGFAGGDSFSYTLSDGGLAATGQVSIEVVNVRTLEGFRRRTFTAAQLADPAISGPAADPDRDGIANFLEYAFLLDPWFADAGLLRMQAGNSGFRYTYTRRKLAADLVYEPEVSESLGGWRPAGGEVREVVVDETATAQTIEVTDLVEPLPGGARFHRLRVSGVP